MGASIFISIQACLKTEKTQDRVRGAKSSAGTAVGASLPIAVLIATAVIQVRRKR